MESYPVIPIFSALFIVAGVVTFYIVKKSKVYIESIPNFVEKMKISGIYILLFGLSLFSIPALAVKENAQNIFANELQANGVYKFYLAFMNSELDYFKFYKTVPNSEAYAQLQQQLPSISGETTLRQIKGEWYLNGELWDGNWIQINATPKTNKIKTSIYE